MDCDGERSEEANKILERIMKEGNTCSVDDADRKTVPEWFNAAEFRRGSEYFDKNFYAMFVSKLSGLLLVLSVPTILKVLVMTGKSSTPAKAYRRYMDTLADMLGWYKGQPDDPDNSMYKILLSVRAKHSAASKRSQGKGEKFITQRDMALTQFGFIGLALLRKEQLGIVGSEEDISGFIHFWRVLGYLIGIDDKFNLCTGNIQQTKQLCALIAEKVYKPFLDEPPSEFRLMSEALLNGLRPVILFLDAEAFTEYTRRLVGLKPRMCSNFWSRWLVTFQEFVHGVLLSSFLAPIFRAWMNFQLKFAISINLKFPFLAALTLGKDVYPD